MLTLKQILEAKDVRHKFISNWEDLKTIVKLLKDSGYSVGMTQGVYDMFHVGHGRYLAEAAACADVLIVGVDSDELTRQMKGPDRPFDSFEQRIELLAMLSSVTIIVKRDVAEDKYDLIKLVRPDVLVMSQTTRSFGQEDIDILNAFCGEIKHLEAQAATSTTAKLRRLKIEGVRDFAKDIEALAVTFNNGIAEAVNRNLKGEE